MSLGTMVVISALFLCLVWYLTSIWFKSLYGEEKVICFTCKRKVQSYGLNRCPKCKGKLYDENDSYYK